MIPTLFLALAAATAATPLSCEYVEERSATVAAGGASLLRLHAAAGELRVVGREGISEVRVRGRACASSSEYLEQIQLEAERVGSEVLVRVTMPDHRSWKSFEARLDLVLEVPTTLAADVEDSSGDVFIQDLASLRLDDSSGNVEVSGVRGELRIEDNSGDVRIRGSGGDVWLSDSSGSLYVNDVQGSVVVDEDSSGGIEIQGVRGDVLVRRDSSGDIDVARVGGSLTVERDGSGGISATEIAGEIRIPRRSRR